MRGERSRLGALYKAKDYQRYCENDQFIKDLLKERSSYNKDIDYIILKNPERGQCPLSNSLENSNKKERIDHDYVYLTTAGLIRAVSVSHNANANIVNLFNWLCDLFYVHKFGSYEERSELAQDLLKTILNDKLSGLYCISLGTFNELYDTMNICKETYPPETHSKHNIYKFGLSKDIGTRLVQHKNKTTGYGRWSNKISLKWIILLSESQLSEAEGLLSEKFKSKGLSFDYVDSDGISRNELIAVAPKDESKVVQIYKQTLSYFPSKENDLCKLMAEMQTNHELALLKLEHEYTKQLNDAKMKTVLANTEINSLKAANTIQDLTYKNEILQMRIKFGNMTT